MEETLTIVPIQFEKIVLAKTYSCIVLASDEKRFGIFTSSVTGQLIQQYLTKSLKPRPMTHDLVENIFRGLDVKVKHVIINDVQDTLFFGRIFLEQKLNEMQHIIEIDARPSDCITLALMHKSPLYCTTLVIEKAVPYCD